MTLDKDSIRLLFTQILQGSGVAFKFAVVTTPLLVLMALWGFIKLTSALGGDAQLKVVLPSLIGYFLLVGLCGRIDLRIMFALLEAEKATGGLCRCLHIPPFPLPDKYASDTREFLEEIRAGAARILCERGCAIDLECVRTAMFLLARVQGGPQHGCWRLVLSRDLSANMERQQEFGLLFEPGQGAVGKAFVSGVAQVVQRTDGLQLDDGEEGWRRDLRLTKDLRQHIHPALKWVVAVPIAGGGSREAIGVLAVDGLEAVCDTDVLDCLAHHLGDSYVQLLYEYLTLLEPVCVSTHEIGGCNETG